MMEQRRRVLLAAMGGTIASSRAGGSGAEVDRGAADLLAALPAADSHAGIVPVDVCGKPSRAIDPADMSVLAHRVTTAISDGVEGVVVTHGTDTMEETAYALALQVRSQVPVVLTGAMRPPDEPGSDATANLLGALAVAVSEETAALGPVVVIDGRRDPRCPVGDEGAHGWRRRVCVAAGGTGGNGRRG
jgi:L-asparaginase